MITDNRETYSKAYPPSNFDLPTEKLPETDFFHQQALVRFHLMKRWLCGPRILDLCCGTGVYAMKAKEWVGDHGVCMGLDYTSKMLQVAAQHKGGCEVKWALGDARKLPFPSECFHSLFSFSALYSIPNVEDVLREVERVLVKGGTAILDLGNRWSLNHWVNEATAGTVIDFSLPYPKLKWVLKRQGFKILEERSFQLFPYWGDQPRGLSWALRPGWKRRLERVVGGKMLDEWVCSIPPFKWIAWRHFFVVRKGTSL